MFLLIECGKQFPDPVTLLIIGGETVSPGRWPWIGALYKDGKFVCGSTLISAHHVITAAHCIKYVILFVLI